MPILSLGRNFGDEIEVTEFAEAAYRGDIPRLEKLLSDNPENKTDELALYVALRARRKDVFSFLLSHGLTSNSIYSYVIFEDESFLELLPHNEEEILRARARQLSFELSRKLLSGKTTALEVRNLVYAGANATSGVLMGIGMKNYLPIHLAAMKPDLPVIKELIRAGADAAIPGPMGKNVCRLVYENREITRKKMKDFVNYFSRNGISPVPGLNFQERILLFLSRPLPSRTLPPAMLSSGNRSS